MHGALCVDMVAARVRVCASAHHHVAQATLGEEGPHVLGRPVLLAPGKVEQGPHPNCVDAFLVQRHLCVCTRSLVSF